MGALNSLAMQETGASGNGYLEESEFMQVSARIPAPSEEEMQKLMQLAQQEYLKYGITTAQEGIAREKEVELLKRTRLKLDVVGYVDLKQAKSAFDHCGVYKKQYKNHLRFAGIRFFWTVRRRGGRRGCQSRTKAKPSMPGTGHTPTRK